MITGFDTVLITSAPAEAGIRAMLDDLNNRWPDMSVALDGQETGRFLPWRERRAHLGGGAGEVYVARDAEMERRWDDVGYSLLEDGEGPFAVLYQTCSHPTVEIQLNENPHERGMFRFEPYTATLLAAGLSLVTLVAPDDDSPFSLGLLDALGRALIGQARR